MKLESQSDPLRIRRRLAFLAGLTVAVIGAGVGVNLFMENQRSDSPSLQNGSDAEPSLITGIEVTDDSVLIKIDIDGLRPLLEDESSYERAITLHNVTGSRTGTELELLELFANAEDVQPTRLRDELQRAIVRRIAKKRPRNALDQVASLAEVRRVPLIDIVFQEWSVTDLNSSIEFAKSIKGTSQVAALEGILGSRIDLPDDARRDIALQLGNEQFILDQWAAQKVQDDFDDPSAEWSEFLTIHGVGFQELSPNQISLLASIARSWIEQDGFGGMAQAIGSSLNDYDASVSVVELLLNHLVIHDPRVVLEAAGGMSSEVRSIVVRALTNLAKINPKAAFEIASLMESGGSDVVLQRAAIGGWIETDPIGALESLARFPDAFQDWIKQRSLMSMVRTMPEEVPQYIHIVSDGTQMEIIVNNLAINWARKDPLAVFEWLQSEPKAQKWREDVLGTVIENLARKDPEEAVRFALEQPPREYDGVGWEVLVVWNIAHTDVDTAVALIDHARNEQTRESMYRSIGQVLINQAQFERAMDWAENLKEDRREEYLERVVTSWVWGNPEQLYKKMDSLPSDKLREIAADWLIDANVHQKALSEDQIDELWKHLPEESTENQ
ncbi:MAG: hypothetical protein F4X44_06575 [Gammaproteobacteria bacterium]|nr:hypothetical protein [Gammaproteobacteria bacterium]MYD80258.1 hypothetical protein [Gammaproteobacteria bacterium]